MMSWVFLFAAICLEVCGTTCLKLSEGFTRWLPSIGIFVFYAGSFALMTFAVKKLELSIAYAIWAGVGTLLIALIGVFWFREPVNMLKFVSMAFVIVGVIGLNISSQGI